MIRWKSLTGIRKLGLHKYHVLTASCLAVILFLLLRHSQKQGDPVLRAVEIEGVEDERVKFPSNHSALCGTTDLTVSAAFKQRLRRAQYPVCDCDFNRFTQLLRPSLWSRKSRKERVSIAINLYDSTDIIPTLGVALIEAIQFLLPSYKVYLSIYENGSADDTKSCLAELAIALDILRIDGLFIKGLDEESDYETQDRIMILSELRNRALTPLMPHAEPGMVLFLNDIITCASDILELLYQLKLQQADVVVGNDWNYLQENGTAARLNQSPLPVHQIRLYDLWVTRGINGDLPYKFETNDDFNPEAPSGDWMADLWITQSRAVRERWLCGLPLPVYSGWGGMAAFDANLFTRSHLRFRSSISSGWNASSFQGDGAWGELVVETDYLLQDCPGASECEYIFRDLWNLRGGKARIVAAPRARSAYDMDDWMIMSTFVPPNQGWIRGFGGADNAGVPICPSLVERIDWDTVSMPRTVACVAARDEEWQIVDPWSIPRYYLDSRYRKMSE